MRNGKCGEAAGAAGGHIADAQRDRAENERSQDSKAIEKTAHNHAANGKSDHVERER